MDIKVKSFKIIMSKILSFFGINKDQNNAPKNLVQSARVQNQSTPMISDNFNDNQNNTVSQTKSTISHTDHLTSDNKQIFTQNKPNSSQTNPPSSQPKTQIPSDRSTNANQQRKGLISPNQNDRKTNIGPSNLIFNEDKLQEPSHSLVKTTIGQSVLLGQSQLNSSTPPIVLEKIDYNEIKQSLNNMVEKTFPNPFPSRISLPDDFDKSLVSEPEGPNRIEELLESTKTSAKSKANLTKKYVDYKREMEFYKKFTNMNEIKKQKLVQELDDFKKRQSMYNHMNPNDPQYHQFELELHQQEQQIAQEQAELDDLKRQMAVYENDMNTSGYQNYLHNNQNEQLVQHEEFNPNAFVKKVNTVQGGNNNYYMPQSDEQIHHQQDWGEHNVNQQQNWEEYNVNQHQDWDTNYGNHQINQHQNVNYYDNQNQQFDRMSQQSNPKNMEYHLNQSGQNLDMQYNQYNTPISTFKQTNDINAYAHPDLNTYTQSNMNHQMAPPVVIKNQHKTTVSPMRTANNPLMRKDNPLLKKLWLN